MPAKLRAFFTIFLLLLCQTARGLDAIAIEQEGFHFLELGTKLEYFIDHQLDLDFDKLLEQEDKLTWHQSTSASLSLAYLKDPIWIRIKVKDKRSIKNPLAIEFHTHRLTEFSCGYIAAHRKNCSQQLKWEIISIVQNGL